MRHLNEVKPRFVVNEAVEQIAYADRIVLNKVCCRLPFKLPVCDVFLLYHNPFELLIYEEVFLQQYDIHDYEESTCRSLTTFSYFLAD